MDDPCMHAIPRLPPKLPELVSTGIGLPSATPVITTTSLTPSKINLIAEETNQLAEAVVSTSATTAPPFSRASTGFLPRDSPSLGEHFGPSIGAQGVAHVNFQPGKTPESLPTEIPLAHTLEPDATPASVTTAGTSIDPCTQP
ncbi:hypothetical protein Adt_45448 [Abeliophyllum distichum]|uniref:Uncharacterized protein n=1 Tax=Abeliophyllum distichum TaxID=126358 RepID=A0ABD1PDR2_9LAMI